MIYYAGIGSRQTPRDVWQQMRVIGQLLAMRGFTLRSGKAPGADTAFELGCKDAHGSAQFFDARDAVGREDWSNHARKYHPRFDGLDRHAQHLQARNSAIVLGDDLRTPVNFIACWTPGGAIKGGTGQALRIAAGVIPVFNLCIPGDDARLWQHVAGLV